ALTRLLKASAITRPTATTITSPRIRKFLKPLNIVVPPQLDQPVGPGRYAGPGERGKARRWRRPAVQRQRPGLSRAGAAIQLSRSAFRPRRLSCACGAAWPRP